jgi:hypothetical protein
MQIIFADTLDRETARNLVEDGYLSLRDYLELAQERGWKQGTPFGDAPDGRPLPRPTRGIAD